MEHRKLRFALDRRNREMRQLRLSFPLLRLDVKRFFLYLRRRRYNIHHLRIEMVKSALVSTTAFVQFSPIVVKSTCKIR